MTCRTEIIPDKSRHICSYVLDVSDKMRHISKLGVISPMNKEIEEKISSELSQKSENGPKK